MNPQLTLRFARAGFVLFCCLIGVALAPSFQSAWWVGGLWGALFGLFMAGLDILLLRFTIGVFSSATFGLMIGVFCAWLLTQVNLPDLPGLQDLDDSERSRNRNVYELILYISLGFLGITLALRSHREEFAFVIPYVRFRQEGIEEQRLLVDTNILIDGRLPAICETGFLNGAMIVPRFVLDELHLLADAPDPIKRERGKRGLECLEHLRANPALDVKIHEEHQPQDRPVDFKLVEVAKALGARLLTNDANLGRVANLQNVPVLNLNNLAKAMRPTILPGDEVDLTLIKEGKDPHQAVGYLSDGTMIVVNHAIDQIGSTLPVVVSSSLQTSAGRLVFAELKKK
ncbi:MAG: PIN/TRAM domain-containing protein [Verrucomicrobiales bacterium]